MTAEQGRFIGNYYPEDLDSAGQAGGRRASYSTLPATNPSLASTWAEAGITVEFTDPQATESATVEQLKALGQVGIIHHTA